jgi:hypothetical protein
MDAASFMTFLRASNSVWHETDADPPRWVFRGHRNVGWRLKPLAWRAAAEGNPFKPKLRAILTQRIDDLLAKADKQTRDTRLNFSIPNAVGVVVVLNEHAPLIEPDYFYDKAWDMLRKEQSPGQLRYPENQVVILISEAHRVLTSANVEMIPVETVFSDAGLNNPAAQSFAEELRQRWADFNAAVACEWVGPIRDVTTRDPARLFKT